MSDSVSISISKLHGYLIDERNSGPLTEIPAALYEEVQTELSALIYEARSMDDPFGERVQILLKERESLREYIRDLYAERTRKIFSLALAKATGEEINREELRSMVPRERSLFEIVADSATACRKTLLDGKRILDTTTTFHYIPENSKTTINDPFFASVTSLDDIHATDVFLNDNDDAKTTPESYSVIIVQEKIEEFQDYSGRCYALSPGDIVSLPRSMADILCNRSIALNIKFRK